MNAARRDTLILKVNQILWANKLNDRHAATVARRRFLAKLRDYAEGGKIALVWGGRDCDGVQYSGHVSLVNATLQDVESSIDQAYEWADGPMYWELMRPSEAESVERTSRDLTMEAYEDGHAHVLYV